MVLTPSMMTELGQIAPDFALSDTEGKMVTRASVVGKHGLLVAFLCNHCPYVKHIADEWAVIAKDIQTLGVGVIGINSNDTLKYPADDQENMAAEKVLRGYTFPYVLDVTQRVAKAYKAACTPDFFLYDLNLKLFYRGQLDDSRPGRDEPVNGRDLLEAVESMLKGQKPPEVQKPSMGCNIKWMAGNEPKYFGSHLKSSN